MAEFTSVARATELAPGQARRVSVNEKEIALFNVDGTFYAIDNTCIHRGGPLGEGTVEGTTVTCPWHGWQYDVRTGANPHNPAIKLSCYPVKVENGEILVSV